MTPISMPSAKQPAMDLYAAHAHAHAHEEKACYHDHAHAHGANQTSQWSAAPARPASHNPCHNTRLRRLLVPALLSLLALAALGALLCVLSDAPGDIVEGLFHVKRAVNGDGSNSGTESAFTKNKLYLVVVFVGLFVVVILAVMLSAWCCKGAFENPCCCPCYLCACCGGLACLECIGCGLCAEGVDQM
ncbi:hypothetical protein DFH09DRAFT_1271278 [Mycena vulgaris]|nr:hypothetical protein DFH09DRAFT_1271278 [Mycena vulgaris]